MRHLIAHPSLMKIERNTLTMLCFHISSPVILSSPVLKRGNTLSGVLDPVETPDDQLREGRRLQLIYKILNRHESAGQVSSAEPLSLSFCPAPHHPSVVKANRKRVREKEESISTCRKGVRINQCIWSTKP